MSYDEHLSAAEVDTVSRQWVAIQQLSPDELAALIEDAERVTTP